MKATSVQQAPHKWAEILAWVAAGEEVQVLEHAKIVARVVPGEPSKMPDFVTRARAVWGEAPPGPPGKTLSSFGPLQTDNDRLANCLLMRGRVRHPVPLAGYSALRSSEHIGRSRIYFNRSATVEAGSFSGTEQRFFLLGD